MNLKIDPDWLLHMAEKENSRCISAGGFFWGESSMHIPATATELADLIDRMVGPAHYGQPVDGMLTRAATLLREQAAEIEDLKAKLHSWLNE
jgi:hypothetical protein